MQWTFLPDGAGGAVCESDGGVRFSLPTEEGFENREFLSRGGDLLFDGYSVWFEGDGAFLRDRESFTLSFCFIPAGFSSRSDGLFSCFDAQERSGVAVCLERNGEVRVIMGDGRFVDSFTSIRAHAVKNVRNVVTVVYRGYAGWCDLYVNGVFSNRKQFPRHRPLRFPEGKAYLGKLVEDTREKRRMRAGCFYGFMSWAGFEGRALSEDEVLSLHRKYFDGRYDEEAERLAFPDRAAYKNDRQRPRYHFSAPGKWMNEPHAPLFYNGLYHIFYQANPHAPLWDNIQWGHQVSRDMVRWEDCPPALVPEKGAVDPSGDWSGSALIDREGAPRIYFTAGDDGRFPNQAIALATPSDISDARLTRWTKHPSLVREQDVGWLGEFRDPFVWFEDDAYFMLVGTGDANNSGGNAALYVSRDGLDWDFCRFILDYDFTLDPEVGHVWELPALLPLRDENGRAAGHILLFCACQIEDAPVETYYFLGEWDAKARVFRKSHDRAMLLDLGRSVFTGSCGFVTPDGRSVFFTIAQGRRKPSDEFHSGWAHNGGLPIELSVRGGRLTYGPVRELHSLRGRKLIELENAPVGEVNARLAALGSDSLCVELSVSWERLSALYSGDGGGRELYYDRAARRFGVRDGDGNEIGRRRGEIDDVDIGEGPIRLCLYLDRSMLEGYLNSVKSITARCYSNGVRTLKLSGSGDVIDRLDVWEMEDAYRL